MAKSPPRSSQIPMLLPLVRSSAGHAVKVSSNVVRSEGTAMIRDARNTREVAIERLRRDGFFELPKKK